MRVLAALLLSVAVSLDGLAAGLAYGLSGLRVPPLSRIVINVMTVFMVSVAMLAGTGLNRLFVSDHVPAILGGLILLTIGLTMLAKAWVGGTGVQGVPDPDAPILTFRVRPFGLIVQILRQPLKADVDHSGVISVTEAAFLGVALAADAFGAGLGAGITGYWPAVTPLVAGVSQFGFLSVGLWVGGKPGFTAWERLLRWVPGTLIMVLGVLRLI